MFYLCYWCRKCAIFRTLKPIVFDCDMGAMNRQIRHTLMFVYIFFHVDSVGVGADLSCPIPRNSTKWHCVFPLLVSQFVPFCIPKPIGFDCDAGTMNWQIRLTVCSLMHICALNRPCVGVCNHIYITAKRWILFLDFIDLDLQ